MNSQSVIRWFLGRLLKLPSRQTSRVEVEREIAVVMSDGVTLLTDRYYPQGQTAGPVVLIRSSYGRSSMFGVMAGLMAERGLQVIAQSVRGTAGSGGSFDPMRQEQADGADTLDWIRAQPWFAGKLFTFGLSYLGNVQWAMANGSADKMEGLMLMMTLSNFRDEFHSFGGFTLDGMLGWTALMQPLVDFKPGNKMPRPNPAALKPFHNHLPLGTLDQAAFGKTVGWWQDWVNHEEPADPWWQAIDHSSAPAALAAPAAMVAGWQDIFLPFQIKDFEARQAAGRASWLTIGPWNHTSPGALTEGLRQGIALFSALAKGLLPFPDRARVRLYLQGVGRKGKGEWRQYPSWPPPGATVRQFHLRSDERLMFDPAGADEGASTYVYDPSDPTPAVHGPVVMGASKKREMSALEQRHDTIVFTSEVLDKHLDAIGPVSVELATRSNRAHTDFYVCLCDVDHQGHSMQVVDGYLRLRPREGTVDESGVRRIRLECWPTAYRFKRGHKVRLIVASGAHPRYARNLGTGEPLATATEMVTAQQEILHNAQHGSLVNLMVVA